MQANSSPEGARPPWGARQRRATVAVYGASGLVGRELVRSLFDAAHPPSALFFFDDDSRTLSYRDRPLLIRKTPVTPPRTNLAFLVDPGARGRGYFDALVAAGVRVVDLSGSRRNDPEVPLVAPELGAARVGAFTQAAQVPLGPMGWLAPLLARLDSVGGLEEVTATWIAPAAADGLDALFELRAERSRERAPDEALGDPRPERSGQLWRVATTADEPAAGSLITQSVDPSSGREQRLLRELIGKPSLAVEIARLDGDVERVDALQVHARMRVDLGADKLRAELTAPGWVHWTPESAGSGTQRVAGRSHVEVGHLRTGVRGPGSLSFFAVGDHLLAGSVRAALFAGSLLPLD